jgi:hypothetical protein
MKFHKDGMKIILNRQNDRAAEEIIAREDAMDRISVWLSEREFSFYFYEWTFQLGDGLPIGPQLFHCWFLGGNEEIRRSFPETDR